MPSEAARRISSICRCCRRSSASTSRTPLRSRTTCRVSSESSSAASSAVVTSAGKTLPSVRRAAIRSGARRTGTPPAAARGSSAAEAPAGSAAGPEPAVATVRPSPGSTSVSERPNNRCALSPSNRLSAAAFALTIAPEPSTSRSASGSASSIAASLAAPRTGVRFVGPTGTSLHSRLYVPPWVRLSHMSAAGGRISPQLGRVAPAAGVAFAPHATGL